MELTHSFTVPASVEETWATFMDLQAVGSCFPGAAVTEVTDDGFSGTVKVKLGPIALQYAGSGSFVERDDATHHAVIEAKGKDKRGNGTAGATVTIRLSEADGGGTTADVVTDLAVTGKPAQFGRGVMQDVSDKLLQQFVACIEGRIGGPPEEEAPAAPTAAAAAGAAPAETAPAETAPAETAPAAAVPAPAASASAAAAAAAPGTPAYPPSRAERAAARQPAPQEALDLGSTVLPVLVKTYAKPVLAVVAAILAVLLIRRVLR
ncbi:SRPBCC family protein [Phycicoccus sp. M110.8]|uniref:SRPBCC family protein n=1 Tax=Phycicoccus sp. M110.8 TaxID=3075433 RepID=UPI0028FD7652|nr:SRPBCC family protein [Phycicoccus sp. M110.8]MDU0314989.1 SRPBCC family protein [Phycicoccus sp. M110.8]